MLPSSPHVRQVYSDPKTGILAGLRSNGTQNALPIDSSTIEQTARDVAAFRPRLAALPHFFKAACRTLTCSAAVPCLSQLRPHCIALAAPLREECNSHSATSASLLHAACKRRSSPSHVGCIGGRSAPLQCHTVPTPADAADTSAMDAQPACCSWQPCHWRNTACDDHAEWTTRQRAAISAAAIKRRRGAAANHSHRGAD